MTSFRLRAALSVVALAAAGSVLVAAPAHAAGSAPAAGTTEEGNRHCVVVIPNIDDLTCFETLAKAVQYASNGAGRTPSKETATSAARTSAGAGARLAASALVVNPVIVATTFSLPGYLGDSLTWVGLNGNCTTPTTNIDYLVSSMPAGWNNRVSSTVVGANCWEDDYESPNYFNYHTGYRGSQAVFNFNIDNKTSSIMWS